MGWGIKFYLPHLGFDQWSLSIEWSVFNNQVWFGLHEDGRKRDKRKGTKRERKASCFHGIV
jgi:hypothetical protein